MSWALRPSSSSLRRRRLIATSIARSNGPGLAAAQQVQQHVARQHAVGALDQRHQQVVFAAGQRHLGAFGVEQPPACRLQRPAGEAQVAADGIGALAPRRRRRGAARRGCAPAVRAD